MAQPCKIRKPTPSDHLPKGLVSFGPVYDQNASSIGKKAEKNMASTSKGPQDCAISFLTQAKDKAWEHVLKETPGGVRNTKNAYLRAIQSIEGKARNAYVDQPKAGRRFQEIMIIDGCLFLQLVMLILGGSSQLGNLPDDPLFGINIEEEYMDRWIHSMLFVGNQIPFLVLEELTKQPFFRKVLGKMKLKRPSGLFEMALYELLLTGLKNNGNPGMCCNLFQWLCNLTSEKLGFEKKKVCSKRQEPSDLIHSLHLLLLGGIQKAAEEGNNDKFDQSSGKGKRNIADESKLEIPSAKRLSEMGINIKKENGTESARIHFESNRFSTTLYLPKFKAGKIRELILESLIDYEKARQNKQEVTSYVKFMSELVREPADAKILDDKGVIDADLQQRKEFPKILKRLTEISEVSPSEKILNVRLQINEHCPYKWPKWVKFMPVGIMLSIVQIIIAILTNFQGQSKCICLYQNQSPPPPH